MINSEMNNPLPREDIKGFTLIELLVTIAIIAILSVVGVTVFQNQQKGARDATRKADINAIATAMEANKVAGSITYPAVAATFFSSGRMPNDPTNTKSASGTQTTCGVSATDYVCKYCFTIAATPISSCAQGSSFIENTTAPSGWTASATWTVCANLENGTSYCRSNAQ